MWIAALVLPLIYVLSIGPLSYMEQKFGLPSGINTAAEIFYAPIIWVHENTPLDELLDAYVEWWERLAYRY